MKVTLIYPPFCSPASPPYSLMHLMGVLRNVECTALDLNVLWHSLRFPQYAEFFRKPDRTEYDRVARQYLKEAQAIYGKNNKKVLDMHKPELFDELLGHVIRTEPDVVGISVVYSSQVFYAYALCNALRDRGVKVVVGGPAVTSQLADASDGHLRDASDLGEYLNDDVQDDGRMDANWIGDEYFSPNLVLPVKTTNTCYYQGCAFCTHHGNQKHEEYNLATVMRGVCQTRYAFIVDDMIHKRRLLETGAWLASKNIRWMCQLRPDENLDRETLDTLYGMGLRAVMWGVESGTQRVLDMMHKGTRLNTIRRVLWDAHDAGISNVVYIMFGFPTETTEEAQQTVDFLKENRDAVDLVSTSVFGLQQGSHVYGHTSEYSIVDVTERVRTLLDPWVGYSVETGMSHAAAREFRRRHIKQIEAIQRFSKTMNLFREHMLVMEDKT